MCRVWTPGHPPTRSTAPAEDEAGSFSPYAISSRSPIHHVPFRPIQHRVCFPIHHVRFPLYNIFSFPCMMVLFCHPKIGRALYTLYILPPVRSHPVAPLMFLCLEDRPTGTKSFVMDVGDGIGYQPNLTHGPPVRATPHPLNICGEV